jgi:hypothetical protein
LLVNTVSDFQCDGADEGVTRRGGAAGKSGGRGSHKGRKERKRATGAMRLWRSESRLLVNRLTEFQFGGDPHSGANAAGPGGLAGAVAMDRFVGDVGRGHRRVRVA